MAAHFGRRLYKGAATTAVAAVAVAALSASEAPGVTADGQGRPTAAGATPAPEQPAAGDTATGNSHYYTALPPLKSPNPAPTTAVGLPVADTPSEAGIPATVLAAYKKAEAELRTAKPGCNLPWQLLAAIGKVESGHAGGGRVTADGTTITPILGPVLNGVGFADISDTDHGAYDNDSTYDRAVGPMQFIPSTWKWAGRDGNGDGKKDPNNVFDAALATGHYLCRFGWDLADTRDLRKAILSYNASEDYLNTVLSWMEYYRRGTHTIPDGTGAVPSERGGTGPTPGTSGTTPRPSSPSTPATDTPSTPGAPNGSGGPSKPGTPGKPGGGTSPSPDPTDPAPSKPTPPPSRTDIVDHLKDVDTPQLTARAGDAFTQRISARAETKTGKSLAKVRVRFVITGDTDTVFTGGEKIATVVTGASGVAVAPALQAGEKTGTFTVRALVVGRTVTGLDYRATVTERTADALARTGDTPLSCAPGGEFADQVELKATYKKAAAGKVAATATLVKSADDATANTKGPYFKDADGKPVRTLTDLRTDAKGVLKLPKLYADDTTGTFLLRVTTAGGATLTVELRVAPTGTPASPDPSPSPSQSPGTDTEPSTAPSPSTTTGSTASA
ncbi:lytic transglycosylase domain-containing protein [Streptomyces sp. SID10815]|uniref:lytic transglycosylase domain-containing protein n=1 Tax=Streptomyces sp. SID10815 TaxID=2706027 RepID=UPI0013CD5AE7|nr:lytic transglycosylase domain-containing protein [Streptomyces sp. SID10815]NEA48336.1 lytic transglycosylase [Streptomyces sp. SID10815]